jgi:hypothetical protein
MEINVNEQKKKSDWKTLLLLLVCEKCVSRIPDHFLQTEKENAEENEKPFIV